MNGNFFVASLLRSPFGKFLEGSTMLISVKGRKTGKTYTTPVGFFEEDNFLWTLSSRDRTWWKNVQGGAEVTLYYKGKYARGVSDAVLNVDDVKMRLENFIQSSPFIARQLKIRVENGIPNPEDLERVSRERLFVRTKLLE